METALAGTGGSGLEAIERLAAEAGAPHLATEARALSDRLRDGLFYVACVGQFKRGKSTLLNALVGEPVLPAGVVPVTAVVTVVRHGERVAARVRFAGGGWREIGALDRQVGDYLEVLVQANSNRVVSDFDDRVLESRRRFQSRIRSALGDGAISAQGALARAKDCRTRGSQAVRNEVDRIDALSDRLERLGLDRKGYRS